MKILGSINLSKIDKSEIVDGKEGNKYLNLELIIRDEEDQYGNRGFISQGVSKERREAKNYGEILGNVRFVFSDDKPVAVAEPVGALPDSGDDQLPF